MALMQLKVAHRLGDPRLACRCRTHLAYNDIQTGDFETARKTIQAEVRQAHKLKVGGDARACAVGWICTMFKSSTFMLCVFVCVCVCCYTSWQDAELIRTTKAAAMYLHQTRKAHDAGHTDPAAHVNPTRDEYYRLRLAKEK